MSRKSGPTTFQTNGGPLNDSEIEAVRKVARTLAAQNGRGLSRRELVALPGIVSKAVTVYAGDPMLAVVRSPRGGHLAGLTTRERQVAELIASGLTNKQIAVRLRISLPTVKDHVHHVLSKTGLSGRAAIAAAWHR